MNEWMQVILTVISSVLASSGLWTYMMKKSEQKDVKTEMLIGLAHDRIVFLGMAYIERGWITQDEYENLYEYLYKPYEKMAAMALQRKLCKKSTIYLFINQLIFQKEGINYEDDKQNI